MQTASYPVASTDDSIWERSIAELQRVIDVTRRMSGYFTLDAPPVVIATMGGFTSDRFVTPNERPAMYARIAQALERVDHSEVRG